MPRLYFLLTFFLFFKINFSVAQSIEENFDSVSSLVSNGWVINNLSNPLGNSTWSQGDINLAPAYNGSTTAYIQVNSFSSDTSSGATISNWLISPILTIKNGDTLSFYTRTNNTPGQLYANRLQVRLNTINAGTTIGASDTSVGDFTNMILEINPLQTSADYPTVWTKYTYMVSGMGMPTPARIGFRYFVTNAGINASQIGIDNFKYSSINYTNMVVTSSSTNGACFSDHSGTANVSVVGGVLPYTYSWAPTGGTGASATGLAAGVYTCTITDALTNNITTTVTITQSAVLTATYAVENESCEDSDDGSITINATGGVGAYSYFWQHNGSSNNTVNGLEAGQYTCTVQDMNSCNKTLTITVSAPPELNLSISSTPATCSYYSDATATVVPTGGTTPYSYSWSSSNTTNATETDLAEGIYSCTVTDANNCVQTQSVVISSLPMSSMPIITTTYNNQCQGDTTIIAIAKDSSLAFSIMPNTDIIPVSAEEFKSFPTATTIYTVTGTNSNGCTISNTVTVTVANTGLLANSTIGNGNSVTGVSTQSRIQTDGTAVQYFDANCNIIASVEDAVGGNILGQVIAQTTIDSNLVIYSNQPYTQRWFTITPANQGPANITLYQIQSDFDAYNVYAVANNLPLLPTNNLDFLGINNLRVTQVHGNGIFGQDSSEIITPIVGWDDVNQYWVLNFAVDSFSRFYIHSVNPRNFPLSIELLNFTGGIKSSSDLLSWTTAKEQNNSYFEVLHSRDGITYTTVGKIMTKASGGNSSQEIKYTYENEQISSLNNFYKLKMVDNTGIIKYSKTIQLERHQNSIYVSPSPNPFNEKIKLAIIMLQKGVVNIQIKNSIGNVVYTSSTTLQEGNHTLNINTQHYPQGIYLLEVSDAYKTLQTIKITKL